MDLVLSIAVPVAHVICSGAMGLGRVVAIDSDTDEALIVKIGSKG